jgi:hypothetical protein
MLPTKIILPPNKDSISFSKNNPTKAAGSIDKIILTENLASSFHLH